MIKPYFKWFDLWVGIYIDTEGLMVYIQPLPMVGIKITWWRFRYRLMNLNERCPECGKLVIVGNHVNCIPF